MPDEDKNFGGSLVLDFRKWWRHVKTIYCVVVVFPIKPKRDLALLAEDNTDEQSRPQCVAKSFVYPRSACSILTLEISLDHRWVFKSSIEIYKALKKRQSLSLVYLSTCIYFYCSDVLTVCVDCDLLLFFYLEV